MTIVVMTIVVMTIVVMTILVMTIVVCCTTHINYDRCCYDQRCCNGCCNQEPTISKYSQLLLVAGIGTVSVIVFIVAIAVC